MKRKKEIEKALARAVAKETPKLSDQILLASEIKEGAVIKMNETTAIKSVKRKWIVGIVSAAAGLVLVIGALLGYQFYNGVEAIIGIDVNPSLELSISRRETVLEAQELNEDAKKILDGMDLKGAKLDVAINAIIGSMVRNGYISDLHNSILVTVENQNAEKGKQLQDSLLTEINQILSSASVMSQQVQETSQLQELAAQNNVSVGKASFIQSILDKDPSRTFEALARLSINDLNILADSLQVSDASLTVSGNASTSGYIGENKAWEIVLNKLPGGTKETMHLDAEDGMMVYEGVVRLGSNRYEFAVNAKTGEIVDWDQDHDDDYIVSGQPSIEQPSTVPSTTSTSAGATSALIGMDRAREVISQKAPGAQVHKIELDRENNKWVYEGEALYQNAEYDFEVDAATGAVLQWKQDDDYRPAAAQSTTAAASALLSQKQAEEIVLAQAPGFTIKEISLTTEDGVKCYEGELRQGGREIEFTIHAVTGRIIEWEIDD